VRATLFGWRGWGGRGFGAVSGFAPTCIGSYVSYVVGFLKSTENNNARFNERRVMFPFTHSDTNEKP
jgi:hypothetical protein